MIENFELLFALLTLKWAAKLMLIELVDDKLCRTETSRNAGVIDLIFDVLVLNVPMICVGGDEN